MYNPATQVQVSIDANLGSYFQKNKIAVGASPTAFPFKKKNTIRTNIFFMQSNMIKTYPKVQQVAKLYAQHCTFVLAPHEKHPKANQ
jgi:hypothetical protein